MFSFGAAVEAAAIEDDLFMVGHLSGRKANVAPGIPSPVLATGM
jgi:hypothetical protein